MDLGTGGAPGQAFCNRTCLNGGVCNIVNGSEVCYCPSGYLGSFCEIQGELKSVKEAFLRKMFLSGTATSCATGFCQVGVCVERTIGTSLYAFCYCNPGWTGASCDQCSYLFISHRPSQNQFCSFYF